MFFHKNLYSFDEPGSYKTMEEFSISTGWKIFFCGIAAVIIIFSVYLFTNSHSHAGNGVLALPVAFILLAILIIGTQLKTKVIISADTIVSITLFGRKELATADVKGCRIAEKTIVIEANNADKPKIRITNYSNLNCSEDLVTWLQGNFADLDKVNLNEEQDEVLNDPRLGATVEERQAQIKKANRISWTYNIAGMVLMFFMIVLNKGRLVACFLILFPILGILIMLFSKGLTKFISNQKRSVHSFIILGFLPPSFMMLVRSLDEYNIVKYENIWLPVGTVALVVVSLLYSIGINKAMGSITGQAVGMLLAAVLYAYGSIVQINCVFDQSQPKLVRTSVYNSDIRQSKGTHYYLYLRPWDNSSTAKSIEVSSGTFNRYPPGSGIDVALKNGLLNVPWYYVVVR